MRPVVLWLLIVPAAGSLRLFWDGLYQEIDIIERVSNLFFGCAIVGLPLEVAYLLERSQVHSKELP